MSKVVSSLIAIIAFVVALPGYAQAFDAPVLGKLVLIRNPNGIETKRKVLFKARGESATGCGIQISSPPLSTLEIVATGATPSQVTYDLPYLGWDGQAKNNGGFVHTYRGSIAGEPVKKVRIKTTRLGVTPDAPPCGWNIVGLLKGNVGTADLTVVPPNPGSGLTAVFTDVFGQRLCVAFGNAAGGETAIDNEGAFKIVNPSTAPPCPSSSPSGAFLGSAYLF